MTEARPDPATVFGVNAVGYDRARPTYPSDLLDAVVPSSARRVVDVGCGTGRLARALRDRGLTVLGVEPDPRMAAVARRHGISVDVCRFEDWRPTVDAIDMIVAGQAWQWVDQPAGLEQVVRLLPPGGRFAAFWNHRLRPSTHLQSEIDEIYARLDGDMRDPTCRTADDMAGWVRQHSALFEASGHFTGLHHVTRRWRAEYSTAEWIDLLGTQSPHLMLPDPVRRDLFAHISSAIDRNGAVMAVEYHATAFIADRTVGRG